MDIIGITGRARTGKDTLANFLVENHGYKRVGFADPLREIVSTLTGLSIAELTDGPLKEQPIDWLGGKSPRQLMQTLGTEWGRDLITPDIWLNIAAERIREARRQGYAGVVIADVRFDNEAEFIGGRGGCILELTRSDAPEVSGHTSEAGVSAHLIDARYNNNGPVSLLAHLAAGMAADGGN